MASPREAISQNSSFRTIGDLRRFEPARTWLWDLKFAFNPFNSGANQRFVPNLGAHKPTRVVAWIPADSLSRTVAIVNSADLTCGQTNFRFASGSSSSDITINFMDDYLGSVKDWLETWMNGIILCNGECLNYINNYVDILQIDELLPTKDVNNTYKLYVYPDGPLQDQYTSDSGIKVYSVNFVVCGKL